MGMSPQSGSGTRDHQKVPISLGGGEVAPEISQNRDFVAYKTGSVHGLPSAVADNKTMFREMC